MFVVAQETDNQRPDDSDGFRPAGCAVRMFAGILIVTLLMAAVIFAVNSLPIQWHTPWVYCPLILAALIFGSEFATVLVAPGESTPFGILGPKRSPSSATTTTGMWIVAIGEDCHTAHELVFDSKRGVLEYILSEVRAQTSGRVVVDEDVGERSWFARMILRMNPRIHLGHIALEWSGEACSLIFLDDAGSEHRAMDPQRSFEADEATRRKISHGDHGPVPIEQCLSQDRCLRAIEEFLLSGNPPSWLQYEFVA